MLQTWMSPISHRPRYTSSVANKLLNDASHEKTDLDYKLISLSLSFPKDWEGLGMTPTIKYYSTSYCFYKLGYPHKLLLHSVVGVIPKYPANPSLAQTFNGYDNDKDLNCLRSVFS